MRLKQLAAAIVLTSLAILAGFFISDSGDTKAATYACSDSYAIMCNGASSPQQFINKLNTDRAGDLQNIYANFGLPTSDYSRFASSAQPGTIYDDGHIVVNGDIVGYSTLNISRTKDANFNKKVSVNGQNYWGGAFGSTYHADTAPVTVLFNDQGVMQFVIINSCGNPQRFTPVTPVATCNMIQPSKVTGTNNRYSFTSQAMIQGGAHVTKAVYDFGDGTPTKTVTDLAQAVEHSFTQDSTVTVNITFSLPSGGSVTQTSVNCATRITYLKPVKPTTTTTTTTNTNTNVNTNLNVNNVVVDVHTSQNSQAYCSNLTADLLDSDNHTYRFTATANTSGGASLQGATFSFDDVSSPMAASPDGNTVIIQHNYADTNAHSVSAVLHFVDADGQTLPDASCATTTPGAQQAKIVTAVATTTTSNCDATNDGKGSDCQTTASLVNTGAGETALVIFAGAGAMATASHYIIRRRLLG